MNDEEWYRKEFLLVEVSIVKLYCILDQEQYRKRFVTHKKVIKNPVESVMLQINTTKGGTPKAKQADHPVSHRMNGLVANLTFRGSEHLCLCNVKKQQQEAVCFCKMSCYKVFHTPGKFFN
jgi:hypothetical protein